MSKRRLNVFANGKENTEHEMDSDISYSENEYDSENDIAYHPANKKVYKCNNDNERMKKLRKNESHFPLENDEHAYSRFPFFTNVRGVAEKRNCSDCSCESDETNLDASKLAERSTSPESLKCNGKSINDSGNRQNVRSKRLPKCFNKNAVMARMNRQRKKEYVTKLEKNLVGLKESNMNLKTKLNDQEEEISSLKNEIQYLKSVLSNSKEIGSLLRKISGDDNKLRITSSVLSFPSPPNDSSSDEINEDGNDLNWLLSSTYEPSKMDEMLQCDSLPSELTEFESNTSFGVCLHVANKQVSLEFCATCSRSASSVLNSDIHTSVK